jgi:hypothetical protein
MARYNYESTQQYAEQKFSDARQYNEEQAKKQEKFSKRLLALDTVVKGANALINQRADNLDAQQLPKKAAYQNLINRSANFRNAEAERVKAGTSVEDYLENKYYTQLSTEAQQDFSYLSPAQYNKALREEASKLAKSNLNSYNSLIESTNNIPTFTDFDNYFEKQADTPRNIASWIGSKTKRFIKKETEETLKIKNERANDALYGTAMFDKFGELSSSLKAYDAVTNQGIDAAKIINKLNLKSGGLSKDLSQTITKKETDKLSGKVKEITYFKGATFKTDGSGMVEFLPENTVILNTSISKTDDDRVLQSDVNKLFELSSKDSHSALNDILKNADGRPTYTQYQQAREYLGNNPSSYAIDWQDEKAKGDAFPNWLSTQIIGVKDNEGNFIAGDKDDDGVYTILPSQRKIAESLGFSESQMRAKFNKLGSEVVFSTTTIDDVEEIKILDAVDLRESISDNRREDYIDLFTGKDSAIVDLIGNQITKAENKNTNIIDLGKLDLEIMFPNFGLSGKANLYYNRKTNQILRK